MRYVHDLIVNCVTSSNFDLIAATGFVSGKVTCAPLVVLRRPVLPHECSPIS